MQLSVIKANGRNLARGCAMLMVAGTLAGCSSQVMRFSDAVDGISTGSTNQQAIINKQPASQPYPGDTWAAPAPAAASGGYNTGSVSRSSLTPVSGQQLPPVAEARAAPVSAPAVVRVDNTVTGTVRPAAKPFKAAEPEAVRMASAAGETHGWSSVGGSVITVTEGETITGLSRRFDVPVDAIRKSNGMTESSMLKVGQKIIIPTRSKSGSAVAAAKSAGDAGAGKLPLPVRGASEKVAVLPQQPKLKEGKAVQPLDASADAGNSKKVETKTVDAGMQHEMAQAFDDHLTDMRVVAGDRIAGASIVDEMAGLAAMVAIGGEIVEAAQRQGRAVAVAFAGMVEDEVEDGADALGAQRRDGVGQFGDAARHDTRIERHEGDRVVAPAIGQAKRRQMAFVDPGGDRHQFDGIDAEPFQVGDDSRMGQGRDRAALRLGHLRMQHGEGAHRDFVDETALPEQRRLAFHRPVAADDGLRNEIGGLSAELAQPCIMAEGPVEFGGIGIDQQLGRIEPQTFVGIVDAIGAKTVAGAGLQVVDEQAVDIAVALHRQAHLRLSVEQAEIHMRGQRRPDGEFDAAVEKDGTTLTREAILHAASPWRAVR